MADRGFNGYEHWRLARQTGAQLLWRCASNRLLPRQQELPDGSYLSTIVPTGVGKAQAKEQGIVVRVIEYALPGLPDAQPSYRLLTSMLDPNEAPALELAALYHERWQVEEVFDELKTHLLSRRRVLRSKKPELVRQEFYGWVLAHYAVRWLLHEGATRHRMPHDKLSFTSHIQLLRREQPQSGAFPPRAPQTAQAGVGQSSARKRATQIKADAKQAQSAHGQEAELRLRAARPSSKEARVH
jgi:Transposase DDE domain